jgi:serine protease Do
MPRFPIAVVALSLFASVAVAQERDIKVRNDRKLLEASEHWIYNDLPKAYREAQRKQKPVLAVFRCIPCEACHDFDEQVVERDPKVRELLDRFVCVRIPQGNHLDLSQFQFDYDMSFAVMYLHHDGTILGRFGTRTGQKNEEEDMHLAGFAESMTRAAELHQNIDRLRPALAAKRGPASSVAVPEEFPSLKGKYSDRIDYEANTAKSCIHCHQIREAQRLTYRTAGEPVPDALLFPWPGLSVLGLKADPRTATTITAVQPASIAGKAGVQPGDRLASMNGQPLVSVADAQWVLQQSGDSGQIALEVQRGNQTVGLTLDLPKGWRRTADISWRVTTWDLRRMAFGGMVLEPMTDAERAELNLPADKLALRVKHVGQYGEHARAKQAGFVKGDIVVSFDGRTQPQTESELLAYGMQQKRTGDKIEIGVLRDGVKKTFTVALQ